MEEEVANQPFIGGLKAITPVGVENFLNIVRADKDFKALLIYVSSPGGSAVASDRIFEVIKDFKKEKDIPIVVLMGDIAASGGYYISSAGDYIIANPATITGSIGVIMEAYNLEGLYEKVGVKKNTFKAGKYKDILSDSREMTKEEHEMIDLMINDAYNMFLSRVSEGRKIPFEKASELAEGKIYSGIAAKNAGLIDEVGTLDSAIAATALKANLQKYKVVKIKSGSFIDQLFSGLSYKFNNILGVVNPLSIRTPQYRLLYKMP